MPQRLSRNARPPRPPRTRRRVKVKTPPVLFERTQALLERIQKKVEGTFLSYWTSTSGSVCDNDVMALHAILDARGPQERIALFVKSDGGSGMASLRLVHLLRKYAGRLTVIAPLNCASAATMLALGADTIQMGPLSYLTAVDTSLEHDLSPLDHTNQLVPVSNDEVDRVIRLWKETFARRGDGVNPYQELYKYLHPLVIGALDRASSLSLMLCREILGYHMKDARKAERIARRLNSSYPAHQYPITSREARKLGLKVQDIPSDLDALLQELNLLYSEMGQRAITDYDEENHHDNEITNILEGKGVQVYYQVEKDWHYRKEERRWVSINDVSSWYRCFFREGKVAREKFHIR
ncbi:MAG: SDH family Clp fold serine proteinase [Betaproteobacteria bacterium]